MLVEDHIAGREDLLADRIPQLVRALLVRTSYVLAEAGARRPLVLAVLRRLPPIRIPAENRQIVVARSQLEEGLERGLLVVERGRKRAIVQIGGVDDREGPVLTRQTG